MSLVRLKTNVAPRSGGVSPPGRARDVRVPREGTFPRDDRFAIIASTVKDLSFPPRVARVGGHYRSFYVAAARYEGLREEVMRIVQEQIAERIASGETALASLRTRDIRLGSIDNRALDACWHPTEFPWRQLHADFRPYVKRFEVSVWVDSIVQALAYGRPSDGADNVTLHFIERRKDDRDYLKGCAALIVTDAAEAYAKVLGKRAVRLKDPYASAVPIYMRLGFADDGTNRGIAYMRRMVRP